MSSTDNLGANSSGITYYPGSSIGLFAAGTFYLIWSLGVYTKGIMNMIPSVRKVYETKICRGRKIPVEGLYLAILGYCAFFGQLGQARWKFYDSKADRYINTNNMLQAIYFLGLGNAGFTMIFSQLNAFNKNFEQFSLIMPNAILIIAMAFKSIQEMTILDWIILVLTIVTFSAFVAALLAETFVMSAYTKLGKAMGLLSISVWYYQTYTVYFGKDNKWQTRSFAVDYIVNIFFVQMLVISWFFGLVWFVCTKNYDNLLNEAQAAKDAQRLKLQIEEEISKSTDNIDIELLSKPVA